MEALFKKQFWLVNLAFLGASAFLLARGSNQFVAYALVKSADAAPRLSPKSSSARPPRAKTVRDVAEDANMFGARAETILEGAAAEAAARAAEEAQKSAEPVNPEAVPTALRLKLAGITWFSIESLSIASIIDLATNTTGLYSINACTAPPPPPPPDEDGAPAPPQPMTRTPCNVVGADATLVEIQPDRVIFFNKPNNRREYLDLYEDPKKPGIPAPPPVAAAPTAEIPVSDMDNLGKGIVKVAEGQYRIPQSDIDDVMQNLNAVATQARIVPSFDNGKANGFKLFSIRPTSIFGKIGMQNGDVINKINGYDMSSPDKALEVYSKLKDAKEISVEMNRRGQKMTQSYVIQ